MNTAIDVARAILDGFDEHYRRFREISASAMGRFERAVWGEGREASRRRIELYDDQVRKTVVRVRERFPRTGREWRYLLTGPISSLSADLEAAQAELLDETNASLDEVFVAASGGRT